MNPETKPQPTPRQMNDRRIERADNTLRYYKKRQMEEAGPPGFESVTDLITDLLHWLHRFGYTEGDQADDTPEGFLNTALRNYEIEVAEAIKSR